MNNIRGVSGHALARYMERAGVKDKHRAHAQIYQIARMGIRTEDDPMLYVHAGWTVVINKFGWVETIYRAGLMENKSVLKKRKFDYADH